MAAGHFDPYRGAHLKHPRWLDATQALSGPVHDDRKSDPAKGRFRSLYAETRAPGPTES